MKKLIFLFTMLIVSMVTMAADDFFKEITVPENPMTTVSAEQKLYNEMLNMKVSQTSQDVTPEVFVADNMMPSVNGMRNLEAMAKDAKRSAAEQKYGVYTPLRELEYTTIPLAAFGFIAKGNKKNFRAARNNFIPSYKNRIDDQLQLTPMIITAGLHFAGYKGRSETKRFVASNLMSYGFMALFVNSIKYSAKEMRPDGSTANSFPSGHTATAFTAATIMHKEYGLTRSPWWSILGYGCATTTGIMRTLNNRHWISDVLVGAGIGVLSTDLGYMMSDFIFKKKGINREPRENATDLLDNPSFFRLELGMQINSDLKLPTSTQFLTNTTLYSQPGAATMDNDYYKILRNGNPFRIPDSYNEAVADRKYTNYAAGQPAYAESVTPTIKVATGTSVGAEAAYFLNKYIGVGGRARITTAPTTAEGLYCYEGNKKMSNSSSVSEVWSLVDVNAGLYFSLPLHPKHNVGIKALYGRRFFGKLDFVAAYDADWKNKETGEIRNITMYGDNLYIDKTDTDNFTVGLHYTHTMNSGVAISAFFDYDYSKPEFDVQYNPYNTDVEKMVKTTSEFSFKQKMNSYTIGAAMTVLF